MLFSNEELIQALKDNEKPFGLMSDEMQAKAWDIDAPGVFLIFWTEGEWVERTVYGFGKKLTYRLRPDYQVPEPGILDTIRAEWRDPALSKNGAIRELQEFCDALYVSVIKLRDGDAK